MMQDDRSASEPTEPAEGKRRRRWPVILLLIVLAIVAGAGIAWYQLGGKHLWSEPYQGALAQLENDPQVTARLGQPIHRVWFPPPGGSVHAENSNLTFKIEGPNGRADVQVAARKIAGKWGLQSLNVTFADRQRISIDTATGDVQEDDAPKWTPPAGAAPRADAPADAPPSDLPGTDIELDMPDVATPSP